MSDSAAEQRPVKAKLYTVSEPLDRPVEQLIEGEQSVDVQFNPSTLKVSLSNSLKENERSGNSRASQYIDKSSSSLTVELTFDTSDFPLESVEEGSSRAVDVRSKTRPIAETFMAPEGEEEEQQAPRRCLFQWGSFAFVGIMESFDETLEFFSPEGTPLRAVVALKLSESRFQFRSQEAAEASRETPTLSSSAPDSPVAKTAAEQGKSEKDWRDTAMFNGIESPRLPSASALAVPKLSAGAGLSASASASLGGDLSGGAAPKLTPPAFKFGASASLGTGISGAFASNSKHSGPCISAGSLISGGASLRAQPSLTAGGSAAVGVSETAGLKASGGTGGSVGFD